MFLKSLKSACESNQIVRFMHVNLKASKKPKSDSQHCWTVEVSEMNGTRERVMITNGPTAATALRRAWTETENRCNPLENKRTTDAGPERETHTSNVETKDMQLWNASSLDSVAAAADRRLSLIMSYTVCTVYAEQDNGGNCFQLAIFRISESCIFLIWSHKEFFSFPKLTSYYTIWWVYPSTPSSETALSISI